MPQMLRDLGEFTLLETVVFPALHGATGPVELGDDTARVPMPDIRGDLVVTTDAGPVPLVCKLGHGSLRTYGWYAVTVNVSDLAAGGARPVAFQTSVEAPVDMHVSDFRAFFEGLADACLFYGIWSTGGNIRVASRFACHGTAIGLAYPSGSFTRRGVREGDIILAIGNLGFFMAAALSIAIGQLPFETLSQEFSRSLTHPIARVRESQALAERTLVRAAIDNSDGLLMSLFLLAERSGVDIEVHLNNIEIDKSVQQVARMIDCDLWNLVMSWGDYQLIIGLRPDDLPEVTTVLHNIGSPYRILGTAVAGEGIVWARYGDKRRRFRRLGNENFASWSYNDSQPIELLRRIAYDSLYE